MEEKIIIAKMHELADLIDYEAKNIIHLKQAMYCKKIQNANNEGKNRDNYTNDSLATLGDAILKFILTECLFRKYDDKAKITQKRIEFENNGTLYRLCNKYGIIDYAYHRDNFYHDAPKNNKVPNPSDHNPYIEAIIAAIYLDRGIKYCKDWVTKFFSKHNCPLD